MKRYLQIISCFALLFSCTVRAKASHIFGADLYYVYVSGNTYTVNLVIYGDCSGSAFPNLFSSIPQVDVYDNNSFFQTMDLNATNGGVEVTPVCPAEINNTTCNNGSIPGVMKFTFASTITLSGPSTNWRFRFNGSFGGNNQAGRSNTITNISLSPPSVMNLEAMLNNSTAPNSSPVYTTIPTPFFCLNQPTQYNPGAVDPNNDNLTFALVPGLTPGGTVTYLSPYTAAQPLAVQAGSFVFSATTGQLSFTPNQVQKSLVVNQVDEYRNGVLVGSSMREMTFVVLSTCNNSPPMPAPITGLTNGVLTGPHEVQVCKNISGALSFSFTASDANGDNITVTVNGLPAGATASVTNNNSVSPQFSFNWVVNGNATGNYTFFVTFKDDGCPLSSTQTIAYTIQVVPFNAPLVTGAIAGCVNGQNAKAWVIPQAAGSFSFTWYNTAGQVVHQLQNSSSGDTASALSSGSYDVHIVNEFGCDSTIQVVVPPPSYTVSFSADSVACLQQAASFQSTSSANIVSLYWDFGDGGTAQTAAATHSYTQPGVHTIKLGGVTSLGCTDTAYGSINVHEVVLNLIPPADTICENQQTFLMAYGASTYAWAPATGLACATCQGTLAGPLTTTLYTVTGTDNIGCTGTKDVTVTVLPTGLDVSPNDTGVCPGDSLQLHVTGADEFYWIPVAGLSDTGANPWVHPIGPLTYMVVAFYNNGCSDTERIRIETYPNAVTYLPDSASIYPGESYQIDPEGNCLYFNWFPPLGLSNTHIANPVAQPPVNTRYFVLATTEGGCSVVDSIDIFVRNESVLDVPNAFTPGSGLNNLLQVVRRGEATLKYFRIFNRWGQKVFETSDINEGWDGRFKGSPQPMGVYIFTIEAYTNTGRKFYKQGNSTLIR